MAKLNNIKGMMNIVKLVDCREVIVEQSCDVESGLKN